MGCAPYSETAVGAGPNWLLMLVGAGSLALIPAAIAKSKGRSFWGWWALSLLITPLIATVAALVVSRKPGADSGTDASAQSRSAPAYQPSPEVPQSLSVQPPGTKPASPSKEQTMDARVALRLRKVIALYGWEVLSKDEQRLEDLLREAVPGCRAEVAVIMSAFREGVAASLLLGVEQSEPTGELVSRLSMGLVRNLALNEGAAVWAVESWAAALGVATTSITSGEPAEKRAGDNEHPTGATLPPNTFIVADHAQAHYRSLREAVKCAPAGSRLLLGPGDHDLGKPFWRDNALLSGIEICGMTDEPRPTVFVCSETAGILIRNMVLRNVRLLASSIQVRGQTELHNCLVRTTRDPSDPTLRRLNWMASGAGPFYTHGSDTRLLARETMFACDAGLSIREGAAHLVSCIVDCYYGDAVKVFSGASLCAEYVFIGGGNCTGYGVVAERSSEVTLLSCTFGECGKGPVKAHRGAAVVQQRLEVPSV